MKTIKDLMDPILLKPIREEERIEEEHISKEEMNMAEYPITLLSRHAPKNIKTIEYADWVTIEGKKKQLKWVVSGSDKYGLPVGGDQDIYVAIMDIWREQGFKDKNIPIGSIYNILKRMGLPDNKQNYERFKMALDRLAGLYITTENAFWDRENQYYISKKGFHIFSGYNLIERFKKKENSVPMPFGFIVADDFFYESIKKGNLKDLDINLYLRLSTPLSRRLYRFLDKKRYSNSAFSMEVFKFSKKIGLMAGEATKYKPSDVKRILNPALDELIKNSFLKSYQYEKMVTQRGEKVSFSFSNQLPAVRTKNTTEEKRIEMLIEDILQFTKGEHSKYFYRKAILILGEEAEKIIYHAISLSKEAEQLKEIKTTKDQYFISTLKRLTSEFGLKL